VPASPLKGTRVCVFDAYGTLFDYASAMQGCRNLLGNKLEPLTRELLQKTSEGIRCFNKQMELLDFYSGIRPVDRPPTEQA